MKLAIFIVMIAVLKNGQGQLQCYVCDDCKDLSNQKLQYCGPPTTTVASSPTTIQTTTPTTANTGETEATTTTTGETEATTTTTTTTGETGATTTTTTGETEPTTTTTAGETEATTTTTNTGETEATTTTTGETEATTTTTTTGETEPTTTTTAGETEATTTTTNTGETEPTTTTTTGETEATAATDTTTVATEGSMPLFRSSYKTLSGFSELLSRQRRQATKMVYACYSITVKEDNDNPSKVYRGCVEIPDGQNGCDFYNVTNNLAENNGGTCYTCQNDGCNGSTAIRLSFLAILAMLALRFLD